MNAIGRQTDRQRKRGGERGEEVRGRERETFDFNDYSVGMTCSCFNP